MAAHLVARLRDAASNWFNRPWLLDEAADEIERLQREHNPPPTKEKHGH